jgi:SpoVK/Ycf46/Vps4 family AAA+-type ATPase
MDFITSFKAASRVSTPLVSIRTFDYDATIEAVRAIFPKASKDKAEPGVLTWNCVQGVSALNETGAKAFTEACNGHKGQEPIQKEATLELAVFLNALTRMGEDNYIFLEMFPRFWDEPVHQQAILNLRDVFKATGNMLICLTSSGFILPEMLSNNFLVLDAPLPTRDEIGTIVRNTYTFAELKEPAQSVVDEATKALIGLPSFPIEQSVSMCLAPKTGVLDINGLWDRKKQAINSTRGLTVLETKASLDSLGGLSEIKQYLCRIMEGKDSPNIILLWDEIEKLFAGMGTDTSGTTTKMTGNILQWSQDTDMRGLMATGVPGAGKTDIVKAIGNKYGKPVIGFSVSNMESGIVGSSNEYLNQAFAIVNSISDKKVLSIATCNRMEVMTPELLRRFASEGIYFFDSPDNQTNARIERDSIWAIYRKTYGIPDSDPTPNDEGWTGAEIKQCALKASRLNLSLEEASKYIVPVTVSRHAEIEHVRRSAHNKYLSASHKGPYQYGGESETLNGTIVAPAIQGRKIRTN